MFRKVVLHICKKNHFKLQRYCLSFKFSKMEAIQISVTNIEENGDVTCFTQVLMHCNLFTLYERYSHSRQRHTLESFALIYTCCCMWSMCFYRKAELVLRNQNINSHTLNGEWHMRLCSPLNKDDKSSTLEL